MKIWCNDVKGDDKIIAYHEGNIYQCNPPNNLVDACVDDLSKNVIPEKHCITIPLHYLRRVSMAERNTYIKVEFGTDSYQHLKVRDEHQRNELFEYFKAHLPNAQYADEYPSLLSATKPQLCAMLVVLAIFSWTYYIARGIEEGTEYGVTGDHKGSLAGIVLALASMGTVNVLILFGLLFAIALTAFILKVKRRTVIQSIVVRR